MLESKNKLFKIAIPFFSFYILSIVSIITYGSIIKTHREIEEYKQLTSWYENLDAKTQYTKNFEFFVKQAQKKLKNDYKSNFQNPEGKRLPANIKEKIIVDQNAPNEGSVKWKIGKTGESV
ncbi:hypothetical protein [Nostoc sp. WHI]|uniref:hypothetical protein n=1 Tax=Nostoc sp. WHI TaxID=2650611 RepID=UPI0018C5D818|nr:hypothetical protein [Nostoc sp. WHI]MBG1271207.1 hypothetical protein [Nostoc sp. WHI]